MQMNVIMDKGRGNLIKIDLESLTFVPKEVFTISGAPIGIARGAHAHRKMEQLLVLIQGEVEIRVKSAAGELVENLIKPGEYIYLPPLSWGQQTYKTSNAILQVFCSQAFDKSDYIENMLELESEWKLSSGSTL